MTILAIAWDIDGTLVDSEPLHYKALLAASRRWDIDLADLDADLFRGVHMHDVWTSVAPRFPGSVLRETWLDAIDEHYAAGAAGLRPLAGALEAIHRFAACGLAQVCVSNSNRRIVDANIAALGIAEALAFSISFDDVTHGKPDPEPYRTACERLGLPPGHVLAVEDSSTGIRAAQAAGLRTAAYGQDLADHRGADVVVSRYDDLIAWVDAAAARAEEGDR